jgi:hypothetical protein
VLSFLLLPDDLRELLLLRVTAGLETLEDFVICLDDFPELLLSRDTLDFGRLYFRLLS